MLGLTLIAAAAVLTGLAQDTGAKAPAQIDPTRMKALENGLRGAKLGVFVQKRPGRAVLYGPNAAGSRCAHIRIIPVDPKIDRGIQVQAPKDAGTTSRMPIIKGLPPCPADLK